MMRRDGGPTIDLHGNFYDFSEIFSGWATGKSNALEIQLNELR